MAVVKQNSCMEDVSCLEFCNSELRSDIFELLNDMRKDGEHCDLILAIDEKDIPVHRAILAASCSYFRAMLERKSVFFEKESTRISVFGISSQGAEDVIEYFYTSRILLNVKNIECVFAVASLWQVTFVLNACQEFFMAQLSPGNCLGIQSLVAQHGLFKLDRKINVYVLSNFVEISEEEEFLSLPEDQLTLLISNDKLQVCEEVVFHAVMKWVKNDLENRNNCLPRLLSWVRFSRISEKFREQVLKHEIILKNPDVVMNVIHLPDKVANTSLLKPRSTEALYVFGGKRNFTRTSIHTVEYVNTTLEMEAKQIPELTHNAKDVHLYYAVVISGEIYLFSYTVFKFNWVKSFWEEIYSTPKDSKTFDIINAGLCVQDGCVYAVGGVSGTCKFDPTQPGWSKLPLTIIERYRTGAASLRGHIYAVGGCGRTYFESTSTVERFDPNHSVWEIVSEMHVARWGPQILVLHDKLFSIGGFDTEDRGPVSDVEVFNPDTEEWTLMAPLNVPRRRFGAAIVNGVIYVAGGCYVDNVEYFDEDRNIWVILPNAAVDRYDCSCLSLHVPSMLLKSGACHE